MSETARWSVAELRAELGDRYEAYQRAPEANRELLRQYLRLDDRGKALTRDFLRADKSTQRLAMRTMSCLRGQMTARRRGKLIADLRRRLGEPAAEFVVARLRAATVAA